MDKRWAKALIAGAALVAVVAVSGQSGLQPAPSAAEGPVPIAPAPREALVGELPQRSSIGEQRGELFSARSWAPPVAVAPRGEAPSAPVPQPPPLNPYRYAGVVDLEGVPTIFLASGERIYEARVGELLDGGYRVEAVTPEAVTLVYTPLGTREDIATVWIEQPPSAAGSTAAPRPEERQENVAVPPATPVQPVPLPLAPLPAPAATPAAPIAPPPGSPLQHWSGRGAR